MITAEDIAQPSSGTAQQASVPADGARPIVPALTTSLAAAVAAAAAAWMVSGVFRDFAAHVVALGGVLIGAGLVILSHRLRQAVFLQWVVVPVAAVVGAILVAPDAHGGSATLPGLVADAIRNGGLLQPPISFDPGWRFILVVVFALLAGGGGQLGVAFNRPKLGVLISIPLVVGAALIQPPGGEILSTAIALVLVIIAMALAYGAELGGRGDMSTAFEARRLVRSGAMAVGMAIVLAGLSTLGVLFPQPNRDRTIPPQAPQTADEPDRVLMTYTTSRLVPLRLGDIDTYDIRDSTWKLPAFDARRVRRLVPPAAIPGGPPAGANPLRVTVRVADVRGHGLPILGGANTISGIRDPLDYDPTTGAIRLADRPAFRGLTYVVVAADFATVTAKQLAAAPAPDVDKHYLTAPPPPNEVSSLLSQYTQAVVKLGTTEDRFNRLQFMRGALINHVIAAGAGTPGPLPTNRVGQMLDGGEASPYEITAAEALLARWAGVPSRIGYGYYGGDLQKDGSYQIRPKDGATFLEVYFKGYGWIPVVGTPPKAKPSTSQAKKNQRPNISEANNLGLTIFVPMELDSPHLLFEYVRYYALLAAPIVSLIILVVLGHPWLFKLVRRIWRRWWANRLGPRARVAVAYGEFRDLARDLSIGDPSLTPVEFIACLVEDVEHDELAWLVTRALWGDLRRDLRDEDVDAAERLARSVTSRFARAQSPANRVLAATARTSLREPYFSEIPNLWPATRKRNPLSARFRRWRTRTSRSLRRSRLGFAAATSILGMLALAGCGKASTPARHMPTGLVPNAIGDIVFERDRGSEDAFRTAGPKSLAQEGRVYLLRQADSIQGSLQISLFKDRINTDDLNDDSLNQKCLVKPETCTGVEAFKGLEQQLGDGIFHRFYHRNVRGYYMAVSEPRQRIYLWFPPHTQTMVLLNLRPQVSAIASDALVDAIFDFELGTQPSPVATASDPGPARLAETFEAGSPAHSPAPTITPSAAPPGLPSPAVAPEPVPSP